jgi:hypothetical protein
MKEEGWYKDPYGAHECRWFSMGRRRPWCGTGRSSRMMNPPPRSRDVRSFPWKMGQVVVRTISAEPTTQSVMSSPSIGGKWWTDCSTCSQRPRHRAKRGRSTPSGCGADRRVWVVSRTWGSLSKSCQIRGSSGVGVTNATVNLGEGVGPGGSPVGA